MTINRLFTWSFFLGILFGIFICSVLLFLIYMKSIDNLIQYRGRVRAKEVVVDKVLDYMGEIDMIKDWNRKAMVKPEEGK